MRRASTLIEITLAVAVLGLALGVTLEGMVGVASYGAFHERQGDLDRLARQVSDHLHRDLANTAWFVQHDKGRKGAERVLPLVVQGDPHGFGDAVYFLRLRRERSLAASPDGSNVATLDFAREPAVPLSDYARAPGVRSLLLNPQWRPDQVAAVFALPVWESPAPLAFGDAQDLDKLRHYRLIVRPDLELTGRGVLLREYRDGLKGPWRDDGRLADNVVRFTVRTNRDTPGLHPNQLLVSLVLQADDPRTGVRIDQRTITSVIAMRSGFSE